MNPLALPRHLAKRLSLPAVLLLCSCAGTETGNPSLTRQASMSMVLRTSNAEVARTCSVANECEGRGLRVKSAWLSTEYLKAVGCVGQDYSDSTTVAWDLLHPTAHKFDTQISDFCGFHFVTRPADSGLAAIPTELLGASIWLSATRADNVAVEIQSPSILDVQNVDLGNPTSNPKLVVALDAAAWLDGMDVDSLTPGSDGIIRVSASSNLPILQQVDQQTGHNAVLRDEETTDGVIDD